MLPTAQLIHIQINLQDKKKKNVYLKLLKDERKNLLLIKNYKLVV